MTATPVFLFGIFTYRSPHISKNDRPGLSIFWTQDLSFGHLLPITLDRLLVAHYIKMPSQERCHEIRFRQINQSSSMENLDCCPNHQHSFSLRLYICVCARRRARRGDMEVATQAGMVATRVATEDIMEVMPAAGLEGLQQAPSRGVTLRIRILVSLRIKPWPIALSLVRSSGR